MAPDILELFAALLLAPFVCADEKTNTAITEPTTRTMPLEIIRINLLFIFVFSF